MIMNSILFEIDQAQDPQRYNIWKDDHRDSVLSMDLLRYHFILRKIGKHPLDILDLGCGDGYLSYLMAKAGHRVTAVDISKARLDKFAEVAMKYNISQINSSFEDLKIPKESFDCVICIEVLEHLGNPQNALKIIRHVLRPKGKIILAVPVGEDLRLGIVSCPRCGWNFHRDGHVQKFSVGSLCKMLKESGLNPIKAWAFQSVFTRQLQMLLYAYPGKMLLIIDRIFNIIIPRLSRRVVIMAILSPEINSGY